LFVILIMRLETCKYIYIELTRLPEQSVLFVKLIVRLETCKYIYRVDQTTGAVSFVCKIDCEVRNM
jgi:hypothetical protein